MISVGSRDGRKGVGLGFGSGSDMEETELEEGEACSYQTDDCSTIDPDVALSYIDVKIQDVLGHFQKDFEGGVSAENLGAKFGGYGSFLPAYQRSPVSSHPRTPAKVLNSNAPTSPNHLHLEGSHRNSVVPSSTSLVVRHGQASETAASLPLARPSLNDSAKRDVGVSSAHFAEESTTASELGKKYAQPSDQKSLKVRLKVGSDNLSTKKKAEIYSGLGLDISPASSSDNILSDSEGFPREPREGHNESPTSILQIMTSFPVHGNLLLSPLDDDLVYLTEKERSHGESKSRSLQKGGKESSHRYDSAMSEDKVVGDKKPKSFEENAHSVALKNLNNKGIQNGKSSLLKKETENLTGNCEVLVANALKLPLLSDSCSIVGESTKHNARAVDDSMVEYNGKEECLDAVSTQENRLVEKPSGKAASAVKVWEGTSATLNGDISCHPRKDGNIQAKKCDFSAKGDSNVSKGRKAPKAEPIDPSEQKISKKLTSLERDEMKLASGKESSSSAGKKKSKGRQNHSAKGAEIPKDSSRMDSSSVPKNKNRMQADSYIPHSEMEDSKVQKDNGKASDRYRDFFGDMELEEGDNDADSVELRSVHKPKDFEAVEKSTFSSNSMLKLIPNGKKIDERLASDAYSKAASSAAPVAGNGSISEAGPGTSAPLVKEDWVCCDKCQKWRLLPLGTNPDSLPEKWLCGMLYWLPGMNRCSVSEEETTKALTAQYQIPAAMNQNNQQGHPPLLADANHSEQNCQSFIGHALSNGGKNKIGITDVSGPLSQVGPGSLKKNLLQSVNCDSPNCMDNSPAANNIEPTHLSKSTIAEKPRHRPKEQNKLPEHHSDGGETRSSKIRSKRDNDQDCFRDSKKTKIDHGVDCTDADLLDHDGCPGKVGPSSSSGLSVNASGKDSHNNGDHFVKDGRCEANNSSKSARRKPKDQIQVTSGDRCMDIEMENDEDLDARKRKMDGSLSRSSYLEQTSENLHKKEKRARVSKSEGKESSVSRNSDGSARKGRRSKDQQSGPDLTQRSLDATDSLRRDSGSLQPSQAATSSSSKVSGSRKSNMQERKSSPVESVSSSPLRFSHPDKSASTGRSQDGKNGFGNASLFASGTPNRGTSADDKGGDRSKSVRKEEASVTNPEALDSFVVDFQEGDICQLTGSEAKVEILKSADFANGGTDTLGNGTHFPYKPQGSDRHCDEKRGSNKQYHANASRSRKSGKSSSSRSRDKNGNSKSALDKGKVKISGSDNRSFDNMPLYGEKSRAGKNRVQENFAANLDKDFSGKKEPEGEVVSENCKRENQSIFGQVDSSDVKVEAVSDKTDRAEVSGRGKLHTLPPSGRGQSELATHSLSSNPGSNKEVGGSGLLNDACEGGNALKVPKQNHKSDDQNGNQLIKSRHPAANGHRVRDADAPSPARRDSSNPATNALKEAKDLKHLADRLKNSGSSADSTGLYFQAALKFLHGASLLESGDGESAKPSDMIQSIQIYSSTGKLCEFCAHEYEKSKDMAAAALAYKCTEVAYMRAIYSSRSGASRDRRELQSALQPAALGESPSSSASDVDNVNSLATLDKVPLSKGVSSPQVAGNHVISAQNRPSFSRLLLFTQDVNFAMEASRKSRLALAAANLRKEEAQYREGIPSVKTALDFSFQDVEGLLHLVRLAMEAIGR